MDTKHVTSLEISKQMSEAGWVKETEFWWIIYDKDWSLAHRDSGIADTNNQISAPLATEILEELPKSGWYVCQCALWYGNKCIDIDYIDDTLTKLNYTKAFAQLWLYLKQQKLI